MTDQAIQLKSVTNLTIERPDPEVPEKAQHWQFSAAYEQRILEEADRLLSWARAGHCCVERGCIRHI
jgi:hypothetical protein